MAGHSLNINSTLQCPHGGSVKITSTNTKTKANNAFMVTANDTFVIAGCPFMIGSASSPCLTVRWLVPDSQVKINSNPTLSSSNTGMCLNVAQAPQGSVVIINTQTKVQSR